MTASATVTNIAPSAHRLEMRASIDRLETLTSRLRGLSSCAAVLGRVQTIHSAEGDILIDDAVPELGHAMIELANEARELVRVLADQIEKTQ